MTHIHLVRQPRLEVIAQTVIQGQLWGELPLVLSEEPVIAVVQGYREVFILLRQVCLRPPIGGKPLDHARTKVNGRAQGRGLKCDWNAIRDVRRIRTRNSGKGRKTRSTVRRKSHWAWSCGKVGRDLRRRAHEIGKVNEAVNAGKNDADRREPGPQYEIADVIEVGAEANEVLSTDPGHGIRALDSGLPDFVKDAEVMPEEQFIGNVKIRLAGNSWERVVPARILAKRRVY